jgi:diacylglycerol kinase family enzyme
MTPPEKFLFVVNPKAGSRDQNGIADIVQKLCDEKGWPCSFVHTTGEDDERAIQQAIERDKPAAVIACGGDGTVNQVGQILLGRDIALGIVPLGSANGLAVSLGLPSSPEACLELFLKRKTIAMDLLLLNGKFPCFHQSSVGMNAKLIKYREQAGHKGMWGYFRHFFRTMLELNTRKYSVKTQSGELTIKADMITFANAQKYGTGAVVNPGGKVDDGLFEVCIFKPFPWYALFGLTYHFFTGLLHQSPYTRFIRTKTASISSKYPLLLEVDGDLKGHFHQIDVQLKAAAVRVLVPE